MQRVDDVEKEDVSVRKGSAEKEKEWRCVLNCCWEGVSVGDLSDTLHVAQLQRGEDNSVHSGTRAVSTDCSVNKTRSCQTRAALEVLAWVLVGGRERALVRVVQQDIVTKE